MRLINRIIDFLKNKWILQPFLIILFTVFVGINDIGLQIIMWYEVLIVIVILIIYWGAIFFLLKILLKDAISSSYVTTLFVFLTLFFAGIQQTLFFIPWLRQRHVLILITIIFIITLFIIFNRKRKQQAPNKQILLYLNTLFILFNIQVLSEIVYNFILEKTRYTIPSSYTKLPKIAQKAKNITLPDIYLIVLDGYANQKNLKKYWKFDNTPFIKQLTNMGFYYAKNSKSNYHYTPQTISSMLNLEYLETSKVKNETLELIHQIKHNKSVGLLKENNYKISNFSVLDIDGTSNIHTDDFFKKKSDIYAVIFSKTIYYFINQYFFITSLSKFKQELEKIKSVNLVISSSKKSPKFVYYHSMLTHFPFYLDEKGVINKEVEHQQPVSNTIINWISNPKGYYTIGNAKQDSLWMQSYLNHLVYTNNIGIQFIRNIIKNSKRPPVIILISDHGFRLILNQPFKESQEEQYENFCAIYFPDKNYTNLYDSITPINVMRIVLNKALSAHIEVLPDKSGL